MAPTTIPTTMQSSWALPSHQEPRAFPFPATFNPHYNSLNQPPSPPPPPFDSRRPAVAPPAPLWQPFSNAVFMAPRMYALPYNQPATPLRRPPIPHLPPTLSRLQALATTPTKTSGFGFDEMDEPSSPLVTELLEADLSSEVWRRQLGLLERFRNAG